MGFRLFLWCLSRFFRDTSFDANQVSDLLVKLPVQMPLLEEANRRKLVKRISNDLARLHRMSFLKRNRVVRQVVMAKGERCNKGYKYDYMFSKQGLDYVNYLETSQPEPAEDTARTVVAGIYKNRPDALELYDLIFPPKRLSKYQQFWERGHKRSEIALEEKKQIEELARRAENQRRLARALNAINPRSPTGD